MSKNFYGATGLIGGTDGKLDNIDGAALADGDGAIVIMAGTHYLYILDDDSAAAESSPDIIEPDANGGDKRWILTGTSEGIWTTPAFDAGDFTANGAMTWTVAAGDVITYDYMIIGKTMWLNFNIITTTIAGTPDTVLYLKIPGGKTIATTFRTLGIANDNNAGDKVSLLSGAATQTVLQIYKDLTNPALNWSAATNTTHVYGSIIFEIQ